MRPGKDNYLKYVALSSNTGKKHLKSGVTPEIFC